MAVAAVDNVEVMFVPKDILDLPGIVCSPNLPGGMNYLGGFIPNTTAAQAADAYWFSLRVISQLPGYVAASQPATTSSRLIAQPMVPDADSLPTSSPVTGAGTAGEIMTDWIDRPPPGAAAIGSWTFEQTAGIVNSPAVTFSFTFVLENDPRLITVTGSREPNGNPSDNDVHGHRSYTVALVEGSKSISVSATNSLPSGDPPTTDAVASHSFTTSDPTGQLLDMIVNVCWIEDNLFVVLTPKDFGDPATTQSSGGEGPDDGNPFGQAHLKGKR